MNGLDWNTIYWIYLLGSGGICFLIIAFLIPHRSAPSARFLLILMVAVAEWCIVSAMEIKVSDLGDKLFWVKLEYLGAAWVGVLFLFFILVVTGKEAWLTRKRILMLSVVPISVIVLALTNDFHHLLWSDAWLNNEGLAPLVAYQRSVGFWIFITYSYILMISGLSILIKELFISRELYRKKLLVILLGALIPWGANGIYLFELSPLGHLDLTPFAFTLSGLACAWGMFRYQLMNIISLAHKTIIEGMEDVVFVLDIRDRIIDLNNSAAKVFDILLDTAKGRQLSGALPVLNQYIIQYRKTRASQNDISLMVNQEKREWNLRISPLYEKVNEPGGWLVILEDITDRKRAEESIRESEEKFRSISANALDGIVMFDLTGKISFWNQAAETIFGYSVLEAIGMDFHQITTPGSGSIKDSKASQLLANTTLETKISKTLELVATHKNGEEIPVELSVSSLVLKGQWHAVAIVRDISERMRTQELMIQTEKMISVGGLAAGMAHELNNPLGGILLGVQNISRRLSPELNANKLAARETGTDLESLQGYLKKRGIIKLLDGMSELGMRASTIISDMLTFSRKSESKMEQTDLAESIGNSIELARKDYDLRKSYDFRNIDIITDIDPNLPPIFCNPVEIEQVVLNLLTNAAQAMAEKTSNGSPRISIRLFVQSGKVILEIEDNGPGMDQSIQNRVFEPFFTTKPVGQGTGLGLSVSYMIITNNHAGSMEIESEPGKGTKFIIRLPLDQNSASREENQD